MDAEQTERLAKYFADRNALRGRLDMMIVELEAKLNDPNGLSGEEHVKLLTAKANCLVALTELYST